MPQDLKIKVCGMREPANMRAVAGLGIHYMGFIFYARSPRFIASVPEVKLPHGLRKTGVFVNAPIDEIIRKTTDSKLQAVQLHGNEPPLLCARLAERGLEVIKVIPVSGIRDFDCLPDYQDAVDMFLLDTKTVLHGGSGRQFNWSLLEAYKSDVPFFLSGGIRPGMVPQIRAIEHPAFSGIDLNSGFEESPGLKSITRIKNFIDEIRS